MLVGVVALVGAGGFALSRRGGGDIGRYRPPTCSVETTVTCVVSSTRTSTGVDVVFNRPSGRTFKYTVGARTDVVFLGNWFCGVSETLALYRPGTGVVYYFGEWPSTGDARPTALADATGLKDRTPRIGDRNGDRCADLGLGDTNSVTWFAPAVQRGRLQEVPGGQLVP